MLDCASGPGGPVARREEGKLAEKEIVQGKMEVAGLVGPLWVVGWLFTIGYVGLKLPQILYALVLWPYYLGAAVR